jgi:hypothetical protein
VGATTKHATLIAGTVLAVLALFDAALRGAGGAGFWNGVIPVIVTAIGTAGAGFFAAMGESSTAQGALAGFLTGAYYGLVNAIIALLLFLFGHVTFDTQSQINLILSILGQLILAGLAGVILGGLAGLLGSLVAGNRADASAEA